MQHLYSAIIILALFYNIYAQEIRVYLSDKLGIEYSIINYTDGSFGVKVIAFTGGGGALKESGVSIGDVIYMLDDTKFYSLADLENHIAETTVNFYKPDSGNYFKTKFVIDSRNVSGNSNKNLTRSLFQSSNTSPQTKQLELNVKEDLQTKWVFSIESSFALLPLNQAGLSSISAVNNLAGNSGSNKSIPLNTPLEVIDMASGIKGDQFDVIYKSVNNRIHEVEIDRSGSLTWYKLRTDDGKEGWTQSVYNPYVVFVGGGGDRDISRIVMSLQIEFANKPRHKGVISKYYDHTQSAIAVNDIASFREKSPRSPILIIGHSWGGDTAMDIANDLDEKGISVELLVTLDPASWFDVQEILQIYRSKNIREWVNVYVSGVANIDDIIANIGGKWGAESQADLNIDANEYRGISNIRHGDARNMFLNPKVQSRLYNKIFKPST